MAKIIDFQKERAARGKALIEGYYIDPKKISNDEFNALVWFAECLFNLLFFVGRRGFTR